MNSETNMALPTFLSQIGKSLSSPSDLSNLFSLDFSSPDLATLQNDVLDKSYDISALVQSRNYFSGDWPGFNEFVLSYVTFLRDVDPYDLAESYPLIEKLFTDLQVAFSNRRGVILTPIVGKLAGFVTTLAISLDSEKYSNGDDTSMHIHAKSNCATGELMPRTSDLAKVLLKMFNSIRGERMTNENTEISKKEVILYVAVLLCRAYFKLNQSSACANVFSNIHTANISFSRYPRSQTVTYRYYLGRFYFLRQELLRARAHLLWAFNNCHASAVSNQRAILTYLIPSNLLLGVGTRPQLYEIAGETLREVFGPLEKALRSGDLYAFNAHLVRYFDWFVAKKMFLLLRSKAEIIIFRNLFRRIDVMVAAAKPPPESGTRRPNDLTYDDLLVGIRQSTRQNGLALTAHAAVASTDSPAILPYSTFAEMSWTYDDVENICISLIDQGFMKANIYARSRLLRLMPSGGFPQIAEVWAARGQISGDEEAWMDR
ncbi:uncharacterized protein V1513DRAFT_382204 [Lipomyces chichibuensis]|uniref:uncharacterized protein n=1 Tax=Lipomyces chichibuensis TaxID=1546026 RepID=UPI003342FA88